MTSIFSTGSWISTIWDAGNAVSQSAGMMGALQGSKKYPIGSLKAYLANRSSPDETFLAFSRRHELDALKAMCAEEAVE